VLKNADREWLSNAYPALVCNADGVSGNVAFTATYNHQLDRFLLLTNGVIDSVGGALLSGEFTIRIAERSDRTISALPAVFVDGVDPIADRHFSQIDKSACLCSPLEETEFLEPKFEFIRFVEQLVIPFLYGQVFYTRHGSWPWEEYAHGSVGLLEAYANAHEPARAMDCLRLLAQDANAWAKVKAALQQKPHFKGHTPCLCPKGDHIRRCHPRAWRGALQLQQDVRTFAISLP
jgi:hypothetical protein